MCYSLQKLPKLLFLSILLAHSSHLVCAQSVLDNNPASLKWKRIRTSHFNVIFPQGLEKQGLRMASTLESIHGPVSSSLGREPRRIPLLLQNQGAVSNGFVTLAPRRSEFFTMPPQDYKFLGNNDWLHMLAVHEFRHVVQFDKTLTGLTKAAYLLFGEGAQAGMAFISAPHWFWEGDAVGMETVYTSSGRGRIPYFQALYRANLLDRGPFSYQKQYLRSFRHQIPNHYLTGYLLTTFLRRTYGTDILSKITSRSFRWPLWPFAFGLAVKKETGVRLHHNYRLMSGELHSLYKKQIDSLTISEFDNITKREDNAYTEYAYPRLAANGQLIAIRYGIGSIPQLVAQSDYRWEAIHTLGSWNDAGYLTSNGTKVVWNELFYDPRWERRSYSGIKVYDIATGKLQTLGRKALYSGAGISPDGTMIATIANARDYTFQLVVLDAVSGGEQRSFPNPNNHFYSMPQFSLNGRAIVALRHESPSKSIVSFDLTTGEETVWMTSSAENLGHPVLTNDWLFYASDVSGIDNIYAMHLETRQIWQVTCSRIGAYNPHVADYKLLYNEMTKDGLDIAAIDIDSSQWTPIKQAVINPVNYFAPLMQQETPLQNQADGQAKEPVVEAYRPVFHLFRPSGWGLTNTLSDRELSLGIYSRNILSTLLLDAGYIFGLNEATGLWYSSLSYQGLPVIIDAGFKYGSRSLVQGPLVSTWNEQGVSGGLRLPFHFTSSAYRQHASLQAAMSYTHIDGLTLKPSINSQGNGSLFAAEYHINYSRLLKQSKRDIYPKWGQSVSFTFINTPFKSDYASALGSAEGYLYLPGLFRHHSIRLRAAHQVENIVNYRFRSEIQYVRGYPYASFPQLSTLSVNYALPLLYPDLDLHPWIFVQQVRANGFYDLGMGSAAGVQQSMQSLGIDLFFDYNFMRFLPMFSSGVRMVYVPEKGTYMLHLLLGSVGL